MNINDKRDTTLDPLQTTPITTAQNTRNSYLGYLRVRVLYAVDDVAIQQAEAVSYGSHVRLDVAAFEILVRRNILDFSEKSPSACKKMKKKICHRLHVFRRATATYANCLNY